LKTGALFSLDKQWLPIQAEIRNLLNDYLVSEESGTSTNRNPLFSINDTLRQLAQRPGSSIRNFDQSRVGYWFDNLNLLIRFYQLFRFADTNNKQIGKSLKVYEEQLTVALRETVPGLVNQGSDASVQTAFSTIGLDDRLTSAGQHQILLPADAFHVVVLFQPTLAFLSRMVGILPAGAESVESANLFLDEFVLNNYLPQLEEKVSEVYHTAVSGPEAFREDSGYRELNQQPLVKVLGM
jgi:exocyst complex component 4